LHVGRVPINTAVRLNELWHSRLPRFAWPLDRCTAFGAEFGGLFYAAAIWSWPVARMLNGRDWLELRRLAISPDAPKNTASRMLRVMTLLIRRSRLRVVKLISYQDTAVHTGGIYRAAGWNPASKSVGGEWAREKIGRHNRAVQSAAPKVRWELDLADMRHRKGTI
jgi:hypothetical protein